MVKFIDITGQTFGELTALRRAGTDKHRKALWLFQCSCGKQKVLPAEKVKRKKDTIRSCGHLKGKYFGALAVANQAFLGNNYNDGDLTFEQFYELSQQPCYYCGAIPSNQCKRRVGRPSSKSDKFGPTFIYNGLDRLHNNRKHDLDNVVTCCWNCNSRKSNADFAEFLEWIQTIYLRCFVKHEEIQMEDGPLSKTVQPPSQG